MDVACIIDSLRRALLESGLAQPSDVQGCTELELSKLEADLNTRLPDVYRAYLLEFGKRAGRWFRGSDISLGKVREMQLWAVEMLKDAAHSYQLPEDAVVFLMHQGYVAFFFRSSEGNDPPVYRMMEKDVTASAVSDHFSRFLLNSIREDSEMVTQRESFRRTKGRE